MAQARGEGPGDAGAGGRSMVGGLSVVGSLATIWRYPVKSMLGEELEAAEVGPSGLAGDRAYALLDHASGKLASAKHPRRFGALLGWRATYVEPPSVSPTGSRRPPPPVLIRTASGKEVRSDEPGVDAALSAEIGREVSLVSTVSPGVTFEAHWPDIPDLIPEPYAAGGRPSEEAAMGTVTEVPANRFGAGTFVDSEPLHLLTTATLQHLQARAPEVDFVAERFRPNLLVAVDGAGLVEDEWGERAIAVGARFVARSSGPVPRCVMTTLAQQGRPRDLGVLQSLTRLNPRQARGMGPWACAGIFARAVVGGVVRRGDPVSVERGGD